MDKTRYLISEAARRVKVESHVLRYWEDELDLKIGRTEMGHRYYTEEDIQLFCCIKKLKQEGMLLKDLKALIPELKKTRSRLSGLSGETNATKEAVTKSDNSPKPDRTKISHTATRQNESAHPEAVSAKTASKQTGATGHANGSFAAVSEDKPEKTASKQTGGAGHANGSFAASSEDKPASAEAASTSLAEKPLSEAVMPDSISQEAKVRSLLTEILTEVVAGNNETLKKDISKTVTADVMREMDFLFQAKERQEEEHFRKLDCLIRQQQASRRATPKTSPVMKLKKLFT